MTHQQIVDKLAAKHLVASIDDDLAELTITAMIREKNEGINPLSYVLPKLLVRWNCVLNAGKEVSSNYKQKTVLALAVLLHKYGFADKAITDKALKAIDSLNKSVALSDDFFRKSDEIKKLLLSTPEPLKRKPSSPESITFYRAKDVISIQIKDKFYAAYIHSLYSPNVAPIIEFYDGVFDTIPTLSQLENRKAKGIIFNDGLERVSNFYIGGMKSLPDLANQIQLIGACVEHKPLNDHLVIPDWEYTVSSLMRCEELINDMFK
ncbi:hypothetical protein [Flavobacterium sp. '19STA2R22 D10 B1']|uniref:hypothetical protein n=1 Tax=Flavobacterium aerium TaxID=3037261 RepID=UPI00278C1160|nr:hypothetical protein [Flavobacterium sp. '19STA2R22 D10 B1']